MYRQGGNAQFVMKSSACVLDESLLFSFFLQYDAWELGRDFSVNILTQPEVVKN